MAVATKRKNTLPTPAHVQALIDALEAIRPAHWTASHGTGSASNRWTVFSEVFRGRIDDLKLADEQGRAGYRVGIEVAAMDGEIRTCFSLYDCPPAVRNFKANFHQELLRPLKEYQGAWNVTCGSRPLPNGKKSHGYLWKTGCAGTWVERWLNDPCHYDEDRLMGFDLSIGSIWWDSAQQIAEQAAFLAAAYLPLLECMVPLDGEPLAPNRQGRNDQLRPNLARVTGPVEQCRCEHRKIDGLNSRFVCAGQLEAAHIKPYQKGGSDDPSNGLWLCHVHHCETEGRIEGNRLSVRLLDHIPQLRRSSLVG